MIAGNLTNSHEDGSISRHEDDQGIFDSLNVEVLDSFLYKADGWDLRDKSGPQLVITLTYFSMTSLSTVGFGDYHPRSDSERVMGSFLLLFGVMIFSYFMGNLQKMMMKIKKLDQNDDSENELQKFFGLMTQFNNGHPINKELQMDIAEHMNFIWNNNRNMFLDTKSDRDLFNQLPCKCQLQLYTDFIFQEFLFKFRRFFSFSISHIQRPKLFSKDGAQGNDGHSIILNQNLKKMKQKIRQIMVIKRCLYDTKIKKSPRPMNEVQEEVARIRKRLADIQEKNQNRQKEK